MSTAGQSFAAAQPRSEFPVRRSDGAALAGGAVEEREALVTLR
jgi:hypothetical protein